MFNAKLPWQPVPVHTIPESQDHMLDPIYTECPKWVAIDKQFQQTPEFQVNDLMGMWSDFFCIIIETYVCPIFVGGIIFDGKSKKDYPFESSMPYLLNISNKFSKIPTEPNAKLLSGNLK